MGIPARRRCRQEIADAGDDCRSDVVDMTILDGLDQRKAGSPELDQTGYHRYSNPGLIIRARVCVRYSGNLGLTASSPLRCIGTHPRRSCFPETTDQSEVEPGWAQPASSLLWWTVDRYYECVIHLTGWSSLELENEVDQLAGGEHLQMPAELSRGPTPASS